jgi:hypothetical protein
MGVREVQSKLDSLSGAMVAGSADLSKCSKLLLELKVLRDERSQIAAVRRPLASLL